MKLIAIRHGETEWNREGRKMGHMDSPLTRLGVWQAKAIAKRLKSVEFSALYSSDLGRAVQTAQKIASQCRIEVVVEKGLRERNWGIFEGLTPEEMQAKYPKEWSEYKSFGSMYNVPEGESPERILNRTTRVLTAIAMRHQNDQVVVVTHGAFLIPFFEFVLGIPPGDESRFKRYNASYSTFEYSTGNERLPRCGKWSIETWNDISHLDESG